MSAGRCLTRYAVGVSPYARPNADVNEPTLANPTDTQMYATE
jgi:hypothetical protein